MNLIILGPPGSGKGTQAQRIADKLTLRHISTGDLLREAVANGTEIGKQVEGIMAAGQLVSDQIVLALIEDAVTALGADDPSEGWILDGFPRNSEQAELLEDLLSSHRVTVEGVVVLDVSEEVLVERLAGRGRGDDNPETVRKRLEVFASTTLPVLDLYDQRYDVHHVNGDQPVEAVTRDILGLVDS